jgi:hypothetical protein
MGYAKVRNRLRIQAYGRCEYCKLPEKVALSPFHAEHILARLHGGVTEQANLAFACHDCNLHKSSHLAGIDPKSNRLARLFHPRRDAWSRHFQWNGPVLAGKTAIGRATIQLLNINSRKRVEFRRALMLNGYFFQTTE